VWTKVGNFWQANGFNVELKQPQTGVIETNWAENRAKLPQDFIRESLGKLFENLYSTGELDKFRTRVERNAEGQTEISISHRGMIEVYTSERSDRTVCQPRPSDPELENEFLRRLMLALGSNEATATEAVNRVAQPIATATLQSANGVPAIRLQANFEDAWRRVLLALDRTGFTVQDRDRSQGTFQVRYVPASLPGQNAEPGFFDKLFKRNQPVVTTETRQLVLRSEAGQTWITVATTQGQASPTGEAKTVLELLLPELQ
jgi:outer membrane protein assembly factor BamC